MPTKEFSSTSTQFPAFLDHCGCRKSWSDCPLQDRLSKCHTTSVSLLSTRCLSITWLQQPSLADLFKYLFPEVSLGSMPCHTIIMLFFFIFLGTWLVSSSQNLSHHSAWCKSIHYQQTIFTAYARSQPWPTTKQWKHARLCDVSQDHYRFLLKWYSWITIKNERGSSAALSAAEQSSMMKAFEYTYTWNF